MIDKMDKKYKSFNYNWRNVVNNFESEELFWASLLCN